MADPAEGSKDATALTHALNRTLLASLPFDDIGDFDDARRGFLGSLPEVEIANDQGRVVWSLRDYAFLAGEHAPPPVNPSLWRHARLNMNHGLFQVTDRIYQIRGFDISNMTVIEGDRGLIVIDPLISTEVARAGLELYADHRGRRPVTAVIYSHSHTDHYGGVRGVVDERDVGAGRVEIWAPDLSLENCALTYLADRRNDRADATVTLDRAMLNRLVLREMSFAEAAQRGLVRIEGDPAKVLELFDLLDDFSLMFEVVEPKREPRAAPGPPGS